MLVLVSGFSVQVSGLLICLPDTLYETTFRFRVQRSAFSVFFWVFIRCSMFDVGRSMFDVHLFPIQPSAVSFSIKLAVFLASGAARVKLQRFRVSGFRFQRSRSPLEILRQARSPLSDRLCSLFPNFRVGTSTIGKFSKSQGLSRHSGESRNDKREE